MCLIVDANFVASEVINALHNLRTNFTEWTEGEKKELSREDANACLNDLKNGIKSIQWDLDELEESLGLFTTTNWFENILNSFFLLNRKQQSTIEIGCKCVAK